MLIFSEGKKRQIQTREVLRKVAVITGKGRLQVRYSSTGNDGGDEVGGAEVGEREEGGSVRGWSEGGGGRE